MATLQDLMSGAVPMPAFGTGARRPAGFNQLTPEQQAAMFKMRQQQALASRPTGLDPNQTEAWAVANHIDPSTLGLTPQQINYGEQGNMGARWDNATGQMVSTTGQPYMPNAGNGGGPIDGSAMPGYDMTGASQAPGAVPGWTPPGAPTNVGQTPVTVGSGMYGDQKPNATGGATLPQPSGAQTSNASTQPLVVPPGGAMPDFGSGDPSLQIPNGSQATPGAGSDNPYAVANFLDPSMQFQMNQGIRALGSSAAAGGQTFSGNTLKDILGYSQGLASTDYNNAFQRAQQQQGFDYGVSRDNQTIPFGQEMQLANLGLGGAGINADLQKTLASLLSANTIAGGQAAGTGTIGANNSITQMLASIFGNLQGNSTLQQILARANPAAVPAGG